MTVLSEETLSNNNIVGSADLKQVTPSLAVNNRLGPDQATFALRGFTQELRTTASVGVYFAEVVAPFYSRRKSRLTSSVAKSKVRRETIICAVPRRY